MVDAPSDAGTRELDLRLADGHVVRARLAYTSQGPEDAPAYLLLHGYTGSHFALDPNGPAADAGWAAAWAGPGKALDTRRHRVLTMNLPGSAYGSGWDGADSADSAHASVAAMADAACGLLDALGIARLDGAIGYSFGGYVALQLRAARPSRVRRALALCSARQGRGSLDGLDALRRLDDPYKRYAFRVDTLMRNGLAPWAHDQGPQALARELGRVRQWAQEFTPAALWRLRAAAATFSLPAWPSDAALLQAASDALFPPTADRPAQAGTVSTPYGHQALLLDPGPWVGPIAAWIDGRDLSHPTHTGDTP